MQPRDAVAAVIVSEDRLLMIKRAKGLRAEGCWCPVTGVVEPDETQENTVAREVLEEVNLIVKPLEKIWEVAIVNGEFLLHWWTVELLGGELEGDPREVEEARWMDLEELEKIQPTFETGRDFLCSFLKKIK